MDNRRTVYTNRTVDFKTWCVQAQERYLALGMQPFDEKALGTKHAYELGYTPDSWAREVGDSIKRRARNKANGILAQHKVDLG